MEAKLRKQRPRKHSRTVWVLWASNGGNQGLHHEWQMFHTRYAAKAFACENCKPVRATLTFKA